MVEATFAVEISGTERNDTRYNAAVVDHQMQIIEIKIQKDEKDADYGWSKVEMVLIRVSTYSHFIGLYA